MRYRQELRSYYRGVQFVIRSTDDREWRWDAYTAGGAQLAPLHGMVSGTQAIAMKACFTAIDHALGHSASTD